MRVLVTGGFGYLGSHIATHLKGAGHDVVLLGHRAHPEHRSWSDEFDTIIADVSDSDAVRGVCAGIDAVVHTAALGATASQADPRTALLVNGHGVRNVIDSAVLHNVSRFIYLSTFHVYGPSLSGTVNEQALPFPVNPYAATHLSGEMNCYEYAHKGSLSPFVLRLSNGFGMPLLESEDAWSLVVNNLCRQAVSTGKIVLRSSGEQGRDFVAVRDIVRAVAHFLSDVVALPDGRGMIVNIGAGVTRSIRDVVTMVSGVCSEVLGCPIKVQVPEVASPPEAARDFVYDVSYARSLGFTAKSNMTDEIERMVRVLASLSGDSSRSSQSR